MKIGSSLGFASLGVLALLACNNGGAPDTPIPYDGSTGSSSGAIHGDGSADTGEACTAHLPAGFGQVAASSTNASFGAQVSMALDENDDPMFAYLQLDASKNASLYFTRWDPCAGAFTTPLLVDGGLGPVATGPGQRDVALAYDSATLAIGIAYQVVVPVGTDLPMTTWLATRRVGESSFARQEASSGASATLQTFSPALAMRDAYFYVAYIQSYGCTDAGAAGVCAGVWFLSGTTPSAEAGAAVDASSIEAGPTDATTTDAATSPPVSFTRSLVQYGGIFAQAIPDSLSMAVNSIGEPALAFYETTVDGNLDTTTLLYWRSGLAGAVAVTSLSGVASASVDVSLAFDGTSPRVAGHLFTDTSATYDITFVSSTDGVVWSTPVLLPSESSSPTSRGFSTAVAVPSPGDVTVVADDPTDTSTCGPPYLAQSTNAGQTWTACGADTAKTQGIVASSVNAAYGRSRAPGTLALGFQNTGLQGGGAAVVYWQAP